MSRPDQRAVQKEACPIGDLPTGFAVTLPEDHRASYYRARYYDPQTGRFTSEDPKRFDGGVDFYRYVSNNPINLADPLGFMPCWTKPLRITKVLSCSTEFISSKGFSCRLGDPKGQVQSLCDQIRKEIQKNGSFDLPPVPCPSGECCKDMQMQNHFEPVNEEFTITQKGCTVKFKLTGAFEGKGEIGTCAK